MFFLSALHVADQTLLGQSVLSFLMTKVRPDAVRCLHFLDQNKCYKSAFLSVKIFFAFFCFFPFWPFFFNNTSALLTSAHILSQLVLDFNYLDQFPHLAK